MPFRLWDFLWGAASRRRTCGIFAGSQEAPAALAGRVPGSPVPFRGDRAPINAVRDKLDHLQRLGVNAVEFMPWTAWPGGAFDWGYMPFLYFAVEDRYVRDPKDPLRRLDRLKELISTAP